MTASYPTRHPKLQPQPFKTLPPTFFLTKSTGGTFTLAGNCGNFTSFKITLAAELSCAAWCSKSWAKLGAFLDFYDAPYIFAICVHQHPCIFCRYEFWCQQDADLPGLQQGFGWLGVASRSMFQVPPKFLLSRSRQQQQPGLASIPKSLQDDVFTKKSQDKKKRTHGPIQSNIAHTLRSQISGLKFVSPKPFSTSVTSGTSTTFLTTCRWTPVPRWPPTFARRPLATLAAHTAAPKVNKPPAFNAFGAPLSCRFWTIPAVGALEAPVGTVRGTTNDCSSIWTALRCTCQQAVTSCDELYRNGLESRWTETARLQSTWFEYIHSKLGGNCQWSSAYKTRQCHTIQQCYDNKCVCVPFFPGHPTACPKSLSPDLAKDRKRQPTLCVCVSVYFECDVMI